MIKARPTMVQAIAFLLLPLTFCIASSALGFNQGGAEITVSPEILAKYAGTYELAPKFNLMITLEGKQLISQASGQGKAPIFARSETKFFLKVVEAEIEFFKNDQGIVSRLVLRQNGQEMPARRISDKVERPNEISVPSTVLSQYAGTYELQPGFDIVVTLEGSQLMAQVTGQGNLPLYAESETKFFYKVVDAQVEFFKNDKGSISHIVLYQGGREMKASRK
jgi:uncharacterized protein YneR